MDNHRAIYLLYGIGFFLVILSVVLPLYSIDLTTLTQEKGTVSYYTFGSSTSGDIDVFGYTGFQSLFSIAPELRSSLIVYAIMTMFTLSILLYRLIIIERKEKIDRIDSSGIFALLLAIATPLVFIITWEATIQDVIGTTNYNSLLALIGGDYGSLDSIIMSASKGPAIGWYLQLIAAGLIFLAILIGWNSTQQKTNARETLIVSSSGILIKEQKEVQPNAEQMAPKLHCGNCDRIIPLDAKLCPYCATEVKR